VSRRTRVKICGLTRPRDLDAAVAGGVDAIGMVFYPASRRCIPIEHARTLRLRVPAFVSVVALFVNPRADEVRRVMDVVHPDLLQFHGEETPDFCQGFGQRYLKAFRVGAPGLDSASGLAARCRAHAGAAGWLFDSYSTGYGGSGRGFDDRLLAQVPRDPAHPVMVLSGGLTAATVAESIRAWAPFAVDVSSGVETAPGQKDPDRMQAFLQAVHDADAG